MINFLQRIIRNSTAVIACAAAVVLATGVPDLSDSQGLNSGNACNFAVSGTTTPNTSGTPLRINEYTGTVISANFFNSGAIDPIDGNEFVSVCVESPDSNGHITATITTDIGTDNDAQIKGYPQFLAGTKFGNQNETSFRYYSNNNLPPENQWPVNSQNNSQSGGPFEFANLEYVASKNGLNLPAFTDSIPTISITLDLDEINVVGAERDIMLESWFHDTSTNANTIGLNAVNNQPIAGTLNNIIGIGHPHYSELDNTLLEMMVHIGALSPNDVSQATRNPGQNQLTERYSGKDFDDDGIDDHFDVDSHINVNNNQEPRPGVYSSGVDNDGDGIDDADILPVTIGSFQYSIWYGESFLAPIVIFSRETDQSLQNDFDPTTPDMNLSEEGEFTLPWNDFLDYTLNQLEPQLQTAQVAWALGNDNPFPKMRSTSGAISGVELGVEPQTNTSPDDLPYSLVINKFDLRINGKTFGLVDENIPSVATTYPGNLDLLEPTTTPVYGTANDDSSGVDRVLTSIRRTAAGVTTYWNGTAWQVSPYWVSAQMTSNTWAVDNVDLTSDGIYRIRTRGYDVAGNHSPAVQNSATDFIIIENQPTFVNPSLELTDSTHTFTWQSNDANVTDYWLHVGSNANSSDVYDSGNLNLTTAIEVFDLPTDGRTLFVRLWFKVAGSTQWHSTEHELTALHLPSITSHTANSVLAPYTDTFTWDTGWEFYWLYAGSTVGSSDYFDSGNLNSNTTVTATNLPYNNSNPVYIRLWYRNSSEPWLYVDFSYVPGQYPPPEITPSPQQQLSLNTTFSWQSDNPFISNWWVYIGTTQGGRDIADSGDLQSASSYTANNIPTSDIFVRLWYRAPAIGWQFVDFVYD